MNDKERFILNLIGGMIIAMMFASFLTSIIQNIDEKKAKEMCDNIDGIYLGGWHTAFKYCKIPRENKIYTTYIFVNQNNQLILEEKT